MRTSPLATLLMNSRWNSRCARILSATLGIWLLSLVPASAQAITSYEIVVSLQSGGPAVRTLAAPALNVACVTGRAPAVATTWLQGTDLFKVQFEPDGTRVCSWTGAAVSTLGLAAGSLYTATVAAINEAGLKGAPSPTSNPFGLAGVPATILRVTVTAGS